MYKTITPITAENTFATNEAFKPRHTEIFFTKNPMKTPSKRIMPSSTKNTGHTNIPLATAKNGTDMTLAKAAIHMPFLELTPER